MVKNLNFDLIIWRPKDITGINPEAILMVGDYYDHPLCPGLQPGPPSQTPGGSGPEVLKRERGHMTAETWSFGGGGLQGHPA